MSTEARIPGATPAPLTPSPGGSTATNPSPADSPATSADADTARRTHRLHALMCRAIGGVLRNAQNGELPLYAWTLGLPQDELLAMLHHCFPETFPVEAMSSAQYDRLRRQQPDDLQALATLLLHRSPDIPPQEARWLAHALASACFGEHHLWEDMGLGGGQDVSLLMQHGFASLHARNTRGLHWKRFLLAELGALRGEPGQHHPGCRDDQPCCPAPPPAT